MKDSFVRSLVRSAGLAVLCALVAPLASADAEIFAGGARWWWGCHGKRDIGGTPPVITEQPVSQTVQTGASATFSLIAEPPPVVTPLSHSDDPPTLKYQWYRNGWPIHDATEATLTLDAARLIDAGVYSVVVRWRSGWVRSDPATLSVGAESLAALNGPASQTVDNGSDVAFAVTGGTDAISYRWRYQGRKLREATAPTLEVTNAGTTAAGTYSVDVSDSTGLLGRYVAVLRVNTEARLVNLSARGLVGTGDERLIVGFVIGGAGTKQILLRGVGPSLADFGVTNPLAAPTLTLFSRFGRTLAENSGWGGTPELTQAFADVGAFPLPPDSADSALLQPLEAGAYTAHVTGPDESTGVALAEAYDADVDTPVAELVNLSARAFVGVDDKVLTAGFVIAGTTSDTVLVRGIGPTLSLRFGLRRALARTRISIFDSDGVLVASNMVWGGDRYSKFDARPDDDDDDDDDDGEDEDRDDDEWDDEKDIDDTCDFVGAFKLNRGSKDSALLVTLAPGAYTAVISGVNRTTGIALAEVYEVR